MVCPYCGQALTLEHDKCPNCGAPVSAEDREAAQQRERAASSLDREAPGKGTRVIARWTNGRWYPGLIDDERGASRHITFDDGDQGWVGPRDVTTDQDPRDDGGGVLLVGAKVQGQWADGSWYPGTIEERCGQAWRVAFDDGDVGWFDASRLTVGSAPPPRPATRGGSPVRLVVVIVVFVLAIGFTLFWTLVERMGAEEGASAPTGAAPAASLPIRPMEPLPGPPSPGTRVLAPFGARGFYFVGTVRSVSAEGQVEILFLDGDQGAVPVASLRQESIGPGSRVHAKFGTSQGWYPGQVRQREADRVNVQFDDGDVGWVPITKVRHEPPPSAR